MSHSGIKDADVADQRHRLHSVAVHAKTKLTNLSGIVSDLIDNELCSAFYFLPELQILGDNFALTELEIGRHGADEELSFAEKMGLVAGAVARVVETVIHLVQHRNQTDGVVVEDRFRHSLVAADRMVPGHGEDIVKPLAMQLPGFTPQSIAIEVLARKVDDDFFPRIEDGLSECLRCQLGITAGIVRHGAPIDSGRLRQLTCKSPSAESTLLRH